MTTIHIPGDNQTVFDRVCAHLARQGQKAGRHSVCQYLTSDGLKCAIGGLLNDEDCAALDRLNDSNIRRLIQGLIVSADADKDLLNDLQNAHDNADDLYQLRAGLTSAAFRYGVNPTAADAITDWSA